jgi:hypothetical protein
MGSRIMTSEEVKKYFWPAVRNILGSTESLPQSSIDDFDRKYTKGEMHLWAHRVTPMDYPMSEELKNLLIKLASPHGPVLAKMYRIQKGLES